MTWDVSGRTVWFLTSISLVCVFLEVIRLLLSLGGPLSQVGVMSDMSDDEIMADDAAGVDPSEYSAALDAIVTGSGAAASSRGPVTVRVPASGEDVDATGDDGAGDVPSFPPLSATAMAVRISLELPNGLLVFASQCVIVPECDLCPVV